MSTAHVARVFACVVALALVTSCGSGDNSPATTDITGPSATEASPASSAPATTVPSQTAPASSEPTTTAEPETTEVEKTETTETADALPASVVDIAADDSSFSILVSALTEAGLVDTLSSTDQASTVFAPTDDAFEAFFADYNTTAEELLERDDLTDLLLSHVVDGYVFEIDDIVAVESTNGVEFAVSNDGSSVFVGRATVLDTAGIEADNGLVFPIDQVLLSPAIVDALPAGSTFSTLGEVLSSDARFTTLNGAVEVVEFAEPLLESGPFTIFAPTNEAFSALSASLGMPIEDLLELDELEDIVAAHVVEGQLLSSELTALGGGTITTANGFELEVVSEFDDVLLSDGTTVARLTGEQIPADNGVIFVIDAVLVPGSGE